VSTIILTADEMTVTQFAGPYTGGDRRQYQISTPEGSLRITHAQLMALARLEAAGDIVAMLQAWVETHRRSPLDGTSSCHNCRALVLEGNMADHYRKAHGGGS
jgi:hypothetical protein